MANEKVCPHCGTRYSADHSFCSVDGAALIFEKKEGDLSGTVIADRYRIVSKIGDGGMGQVWLAEHVRMRRRCAIKILRPGLVSDHVAAVRFNREAENASQISHPNVCAIYDFGETPEGLLYLAMEYIDGEPLSALLEREGLMIPVRAADVVAQTADALHAAHALGMVHRDLKPDNIMVGKTRVGTDHVKIVDFGIARIMSSEGQHVTSTGIAVGTPEYMAPEQFAGDSVDARTDLYALALVAFHCLTGEHAYSRGTTMDAMVARLTQPPRRLKDARPEIPWPDALQATFDRALSADPNARHDDVVEFANEVDAAVAELPVSETAEHYLEALSTRRLTPQKSLARVMTPPFGRPTAERSVVDGALASSEGIVDRRMGPRVGPSIPGVATVTGAMAAAAGGSSIEEVGDAAPATEPAEASRGDEERETADAAAIFAPPAFDSAEPPAAPADLSEVGAAPAPAKPPVNRFAVAALGLATALALGIWAATGGGEGEAATPANGIAPDSQAAAAITPAADSLAAATPAAIDSAPAAAAPVGAVTADSIRAHAHRGVVTLAASTGQGAPFTGFLVDTTAGAGVVLTAARYVPQGADVDIVFGDSVRVRTRVLTTDAARGVAALGIALAPCAGCRPLALASADSLARVADTVVALGAPGAGTIVAKGVVSRADSTGLQIDGLGRSAAAGRPIAAARGIALGMLAGTRGTPTVVRAASLRPIVARARTALRSGGAPSTAVLPAWPSTPFPENVAFDSAALSGYQRTFGGDRGVHVLLMTPPVMRWRSNRAAAQLLALKNPVRVDQAPYRYELVDPINHWPDFNRIVRDRDAVVVITAVPNLLDEIDYSKVLQIADPKVDVRSVSLYRDGVLVQALDSGRTPAVAAVSEYVARRNRPARTQGIIAVRLDAFAPANARYEVRVDVGTPTPLTIDVTDAARAVRADLARWRSASR